MFMSLFSINLIIYFKQEPFWENENIDVKQV